MGKRLFQLLINGLKYLSEVIFPFDEKCICCEEYSEELLCRSCRGRIKKLSSSYSIKKEGTMLRAYSIAYYADSMKKIILSYKYKNNFRALEVFEELAIEFIDTRGLSFDLITYVPLSKKAYKKRGFNQSKLLAERIASVYNKECRDLLKKEGSNLEQKKLSLEDRWGNLEGAYSLKESNCYHGKRILLVDDVITSGATAYYCARELKKITDKEVLILSLAKGSF
ncbi:ComF family protein [Alloiococcus sp. CFN-8]|uniref:ComF family protein n=1 Tax=Alloiococcus sp. CFN-8 TaxID=3416081 RepID=UPI003CE711B0